MNEKVWQLTLPRWASLRRLKMRSLYWVAARAMDLTVTNGKQRHFSARR